MNSQPHQDLWKLHIQTQLLGFDGPHSPSPNHGTNCRTGLASPWAQIQQLEKWGSPWAKQDLGSGNEIYGWREDQRKKRSKKVNSLVFGIKSSSCGTAGETNSIQGENSCLGSPAGPKKGGGAKISREIHQWMDIQGFSLGMSQHTLKGLSCHRTHKDWLHRCREWGQNTIKSSWMCQGAPGTTQGKANLKFSTRIWLNY